jgi:hypothetical protein
MRDGNIYRGSRRNEARKAGLLWRFLDMTVDSHGSRKLYYPFQRLGKAATAEATAAARIEVLREAPALVTEPGRFNGGELRRLRSERGVGSAARLSDALRASFT